MASSSVSSAKKRQDEKHTKLLREQGALQENRQCFDCHQRGPTYVNMTIGSFVCTSCSGILRGLNPPHRVKSISMASFTPDEIELLKGRGNEFCKKVWLGLYDGDNRTFDGFRDEQAMKDFLALKYEKKRWYVNPSEISRQEMIMAQSSKKMENSPSVGSTSSGGGGGSGGSKSLFDPSFTPPTNSAQPRPQPPPTQAAKPAQVIDLFGGDDPFASSANSLTTVPKSETIGGFGGGDGGFANFANFDSSFKSPPPAQLPPPGFGTSLIPPPAVQQPDPSNIPKSATVPAGFGGPSLQPTGQQAPAPPAPTTSSGPDYSALKELDSMFSQPDSSAPTSNGNGFGGAAGGPATEQPSSYNSPWSAPSGNGTTNPSSASGGFGSLGGVTSSQSGGSDMFGGGGSMGSGLPKSMSAMGGGFGGQFPSSEVKPGFGAGSNPFFLAGNGGQGGVQPSWGGQMGLPTQGPPQPQGPPNPFFGGGQQQQSRPQQQGYQQGAQPQGNPFGNMVGPGYAPQQQQQQHPFQSQQQMQNGQSMGAMWGQPQQQAFPTQPPVQQPNPFMGGGQAVGGQSVMDPTHQQMNWNPFL